MTQEEFATFLGTSKQNISRYESGEVSPKISTAASIARKLGISLAQLDGDETEANDKTPTTSYDEERAHIVELFATLNEENQAKLIEYAQLLLTAQSKVHDSQA